MHHRRLKMPDGRLVETSPDTLELFLAMHPCPAYMARQPTSLVDVDAPSSRERSYSTESFDIRRLAGREITALGVGSVGGRVAHGVAHAGLCINVIDPGTVQARHAQGGRTVYDPTQVGLKKVYALKQKVERDFPGTIINPLPYNTAEIPDTELKSMFARSLVVILAIDDPEQVLRAGKLAYRVTELVQPAMHAKGESGHIVVSIPFVTPCLRCSLGINDAKDINRLDHEPAASADIAAVAQQAARIALDIAYSKVTGRPISRWDVSKSLIFIANTKQDVSPEGPGIHFESCRKRPGCSVCDNPTPYERNTNET